MRNQIATQFTFLPFKIKNEQEINFNYQLKIKNRKYFFQEKILLPKPISKSINQNLLDKVLYSLSFILGISYFKTYCPKKIFFSNYQLTKKQADFWNKVYTKGLGEFFYKNKIDFRNLIQFPFSNRKNKKLFPSKLLETSLNKNESQRQDRAILGIGGGKDSIVAAEILKKKNKDFSLFVVYHQKKPPIIKSVVKIINKPAIWIKRIIDPRLFALNNQKGVYNGHVPFNAILSFIGLLIAVIYDFQEIITANEKDANEGNLIYLNEEINHQWSKSKEYEELFNHYVKENLSPNVRYYSILRSFDELQIAQEFSYHPQYFFYFSSCNNNFKIINKKNKKLWCGQCPKCLFTFLVLSPFIKKETMVKIFQNNLLQKKELLPLYENLLGLKGHKPFECVGTKQTVICASKKLAQMKEYADDFLIQFFKKKYAF